MKKKDFKSYREKNVKALKEEAAKLKKEAEVFYTKIKAGQEKSTSGARSIRKDIARIKTLISEKEILEKEVKKEEKDKEG